MLEELLHDVEAEDHVLHLGPDRLIRRGVRVLVGGEVAEFTECVEVGAQAGR
jgi:hypothetical protein